MNITIKEDNSSKTLNDKIIKLRLKISDSKNMSAYVCMYNKYLCVCVCVCVYIYIYVYVCIMHICMHIYLYSRCVCVHTHTDIYLYIL